MLVASERGCLSSLWGLPRGAGDGRKRLDGKRAAGGDSRGRVEAGLLCVGGAGGAAFKRRCEMPR